MSGDVRPAPLSVEQVRAYTREIKGNITGWGRWESLVASHELLRSQLEQAQRECAEAKAAAERANARLDERSAEYTQFCCEIADAADSKVPATAVEAVKNICAQRDAARVEAEKLREALEFYADPDSYAAIAFLFDPPCGGFAEDFDAPHDNYERPMPGSTARAALSTPPAEGKK